MNRYLYLIEAGSAAQAMDIAHSHGLKKHEWKYIPFKTPLCEPFELPYGYREQGVVKVKFRKSEKYTLDIAIENWKAEVQEIYKSMEVVK